MSFVSYIDSENRTSGNTSTFSVNINLPTGRNFTKVSLLSAQIPKSYYMVGISDTFSLTELTGGTPQECQISAGNYTPAELAASIKTELDLESENGYTYTVTFNDQTGKFIIENPTEYFLLDNFVSSNGSNTIADFLGISNGVTRYNSGAGTNNAMVGNSVALLQKYSTIRITSNLSVNGTNDVLAEIPSLSTTNFDIIQFEQKLSNVKYDLVNMRSTNFTFNIVDKNGAAIEFNGINSRLSLLFE